MQSWTKCMAYFLWFNDKCNKRFMLNIISDSDVIWIWFWSIHELPHQAAVCVQHPLPCAGGVQSRANPPPPPSQHAWRADGPREAHQPLQRNASSHQIINRCTGEMPMITALYYRINRDKWVCQKHVRVICPPKIKRKISDLFCMRKVVFKFSYIYTYINTCLTSYIRLKHRCIYIRVKINRVLEQSGHALELCVVSQYLWLRRSNIQQHTENHIMAPKNLVECNFIPAMCPEHQWVWGKNLKEKGTNREVIMIEYDFWIMCSTMKDNILQTKASAQFHWKKNCSNFFVCFVPKHHLM